MTCATCRRLRRRMAEELAKLKAAIAGPTRKPELERAIADRRERISRRQTLRALLAGVAISTGLARTVLELVDDQPLTFNGVPIYFDGFDETTVLERDLERAWAKVMTGGGKPDVVWISESQLEEVRRYWKE